MDSETQKMIDLLSVDIPTGLGKVSRFRLFPAPYDDWEFLPDYEINDILSEI